MKNKLEQKVEKGQKLNRQEKEMKRIIDGGNVGDTFIPPVRLADAQQGEYNEYSKTNDDGEQVRTHTGMVILNPAVEFEEGTYNLVGMNDGDIQVGISALDGSIVAGNGQVTISFDGIKLYRYHREDLLVQTASSDIKWYDSYPGSPTASLVAGIDVSYASFGGVIFTSGLNKYYFKTVSFDENPRYVGAFITTPTSLTVYENTGGVLPNETLWTGVKVGGIRFSTTTSLPDHHHLDVEFASTAGILEWNADRDTLDLMQTGTTLQLGQEVHFYVKNQTGSTITDGTAVMFAGSLGASGILLATPAIADGTYSAIYIMGIATQDIPNGEAGKVTFFGEVRGIDTSMYSDGDILYLDPSTPGGLTNVAPSAPNLKYAIAAVVNANSNGTIFVRAIYTQNLSELNDVEITSPSSGQVIKYNGTKWINGTVTATVALDDLTDVTITTPSSGQVIKYNGTTWVNDTVSTSVALDDLTDVTITTPANNDILKYNGTTWVNAVAPTPSIALNDLTDAVISTASTSQVLKFDGSNWVNAEIPQFLNPSYQLIAATECYGVGASDLAPFARGAIGTGTLTFRTAEAAHPGLVRFDSVATNNTGYYIGLTGSYPIILSTGDECQAIFRFATNANNSNCNGAFGWMVDITNAAVTSADSLCLRWTGNGTTIDLGFYGRVGSVGSLANFATLSVNTWYRLKINNGGAGAVNAYVYDSSGTQLATYNYTGSITTAGQQFGIKGYRANNVATTLFDLDYISLYSTTALAR